MKTKVVGVIPARFGSTRFPGKPLFKIAGKPMIEWVILATQTAKRLNQVVVATDNEEIADVANKLGVMVVMTDSYLPSGSDRVWAAVKELECEIVVNIQGDEPLLQGAMIDLLVHGFQATNNEMGTLVKELEKADLHNLNVVKAILNHKNEAIYFSRMPIPYTRIESPSKIEACWQHLGLYAYKKSFLKKFCETAPVLIEQGESLEQLRALWLGAKIQTVIIDQQSGFKCIGVDTPEDVKKVEPFLKR